MEKIMNLEYSSTLTNLIEANPSFDRGTLRIAYTGKNRNRSFIGKNDFERAIPSMFGCPVVANYSVEENEIGSHDAEFVDTKDGDVRYVNLTEPVGFVPPGAVWGWEIVEDDGVMHQYLTTEVMLWKRQAAYKKIKENGITSQSMEISVTDGEMCDDYYKINDFYFTAFCLLGTAEPCFESAALFTFEHKEEFQRQLTEMYEEFKLAFTADEDFQVKEVADKKMDKLNELLSAYGLLIEDLGFEVEDLTDEELEAKFIETYGELEVVSELEVEPAEAENEFEAEGEVKGESETEVPSGEDFSLNSQVCEALSDYVRGMETVDYEWGSLPRYYMFDFDESANEVYFEDSTDWKIYGAVYSFDGDIVSIDLETMKRKKFAIVDFVEGTEQSVSYAEHFENATQSIIDKYTSKYAELETKYNALISEAEQAQKEELFERFEAKIGDAPEFASLKINAMDYSIEELENKLYALIGRKQFKFSANAAKSPKAPAFPTVKTEVEEQPYGDLFNFMNNK